MVFSFKRILSHLIYPPLCLHCEAVLQKRVPVLCAACLEQFCLERPEGRCQICFCLLQKGCCQRCRSRPRRVTRQIAVSQPIGPAATLLQRLGQRDLSVVQPMAVLMSYHWLDYQMPLPDRLIPLPSFFSDAFHPTVRLAQEIGRLFSVDVLSALKKKWDRKAFWTQGEFESVFTVRAADRERICGQTLLLISVRLEDQQFCQAAEALQPFAPKAIYGLSFSINDNPPTSSPDMRRF